MRPAEHAVRQWGDDIGGALEVLGDLRASASPKVPRPDGAVLDALEELTTRTRAVARSLLDTTAGDAPSGIPASFGEEYSRLLPMIAAQSGSLPTSENTPLPTPNWPLFPAPSITSNVKLPAWPTAVPGMPPRSGSAACPLT